MVLPLRDIRDRILSRDDPKLTMSNADSVMTRTVSADDALYGCNQWSVSKPISEGRIIQTWEIYHGIRIALVVTAEGKYRILRSVDGVQYSTVHEHDTKIYNIFYVDQGRAFFSATDGWYLTEDAGMTWTLLDADGPAAQAAVFIAQGEDWIVVAYGEDRKIYQYIYPDGDWAEVYDASDIAGKWFPALAGSALAVVAGIGNKLIRSTAAGEEGSWSEIHETSGVIKSILISDRGKEPTILVEVESADTEGSKLYWSYDLCDSLQPDLNRTAPVSAVQTVFLTGTNTQQSLFAVFGYKKSEDGKIYNLIQGEK